MKKSMEEKWEQAFHSPGEKVKLGLDVVCDNCSKDWTDSAESGGFLFGSYAFCPDCAPAQMAKVKQYHEEKHIRGICPPGMSFADYVCQMRGPEAGILVTIGWPEGWK